MVIAALGILALATAAPLALDRVELVAEEPGTWLLDDLPTVTSRPASTTLRWLEQVQPVLRLGDGPLRVGVSWTMQGVFYAHTLGALELEGGVQTSLGLPVGAGVSAGLPLGSWRLGAGVGARCGASWADPRFTAWRVVPAVGLAWRPRAG